MFIESVSRRKQRLQEYAVYSAAFSYPNDAFFTFFPQLAEQKKRIVKDHDVLFRQRGIWLYTTEYTAKGDFQKSYSLADINGFYKAFGLQITKERPDSLSVELEFMHYLIFKAHHAASKDGDSGGKAEICLQAQCKFFNEYLYPGASSISHKIVGLNEGTFYEDIGQEMLCFLDEEKKILETDERCPK